MTDRAELSSADDASLRRLLIVGAGGFGREAAQAVQAVNRKRPTWDLLGFLDDNPALQHGVVDGLPVLGPLADVKDFADAQLVVSVGRPSNYLARRSIVQRLNLAPSRYATVIHPTAVLPLTAQIGPGSVLLATVVATTGIRVGAHVVVMPGAVFTHDDTVEDYVTIGAHACLAGNVRIGEGAYIGAGALIREDCVVGPWALIGMGAVVTSSVPAHEVWAGVPARFLRRADAQPTDSIERRNQASRRIATRRAEAT